MIVAKIVFALCACLLAVGIVQWKHQNGKREKQKYILEYAEKVTDLETQKKEEQRRQTMEEEKRQKFRTFQLDFMITHGSAFGGCCAICADGRRRKGSVPLDHVLMYGKHPSGKDFTYYIEEQGLEIRASEEPDALLVRSKEAPFEIREEGMGRDRGVSLHSALIKKDILYYIILESRHEISIRATRTC
ncbi:MAG: hypothetical protein Q4D60_04885 [Eubacteriales bacterium]|nr:hypothetical protein [Eubacteriales bacterium]